MSFCSRYRNNSLSYLIVALLLWGSVGCSSYKKLNNSNLAYLYDINKCILLPSFKVVHLNDSVSRIYYSVNTRDLLYVRNGTSGKHISRYSVHYSLLGSYDLAKVSDSATCYFSDTSMIKPKGKIIGSIDVNMKRGDSSLLYLKFTDICRNVFNSSFVNLNKKTSLSLQWFQANDTSGLPVFYPWIHKDNSCSIRYNGNCNIKNLYVRYYKPNLKLPDASYIVKEDSLSPIFFSKADAINIHGDNAVSFTSNKEGHYFFQADSSLNQGFSLCIYDETYPVCGSTKMLLAPLRYITTDEEYSLIENSSDVKVAIDKFWLKLADSQERARELIRLYYGAVQEANVLFSTDIDGWRTDMGMIYVVMGAPDVVYRSNNMEIWVYGDETNINSKEYRFERVANPFFDNDYRLIRMASYKNSWFNAVELWRK